MVDAYIERLVSDNDLERYSRDDLFVSLIAAPSSTLLEPRR